MTVQNPDFNPSPISMSLTLRLRERRRQIGTTPDTVAVQRAVAAAFEGPYGSAKRPGLESEERRSPLPSRRIGYVRLSLTSPLPQKTTYTESGI